MKDEREQNVICFFYKNLLTDKEMAKGIVKTTVSVEELVEEYRKENSRYEDVIDYVEKNDINSTYVELKDYTLKEAENQFPMNALICINNKKYIEFKNKKRE